MAEHFRLTLETTDATIAVIALLRRHTGKPISDLRHAIANRKPFLDEVPHHNQYSEFITRLTPLLDDLEAEGISFRVEVPIGRFFGRDYSITLASVRIIGALDYDGTELRLFRGEFSFGRVVH